MLNLDLTLIHCEGEKLVKESTAAMISRISIQCLCSKLQMDETA